MVWKWIMKRPSKWIVSLSWILMGIKMTKNIDNTIVILMMKMNIRKSKLLEPLQKWIDVSTYVYDRVIFIEKCSCGRNSHLPRLFHYSHYFQNRRTMDFRWKKPPENLSVSGLWYLERNILMHWIQCKNLNSFQGTVSKKIRKTFKTFIFFFSFCFKKR